MGPKKMEYKRIFLIVMLAILRSGNLCPAQNETPKTNCVNEPNKVTRGDTNKSVSFLDSSVKLQEGTKLVFAEVEDAKKLLTTRDMFIKSLSPFDRSARMKTDKDVSEKEFLEHIANQVRSWTAEEKHRIKGVVESIANKLSRFKLDFPQKILLIKTTGKEEGRAAYCRPNAIVLPQNMLDKQNVGLEKLITHELFHILSSNAPELKEALYKVIHFKKCNNIKLPNKLREIKITNPDAPKNDHYIEVQYDGQPVKVVPIIYSSSAKYDVQKGGEFFNYLTLKLLVVEKVDDQWHFKYGGNAEPILLEIQQVPDYFNKIGMNTNYIIHPEEILAENFILMVQGSKNLKSQWVVEKMEHLFQTNSVKPSTKSRDKSK